MTRRIFMTVMLITLDQNVYKIDQLVHSWGGVAVLSLWGISK